MEKLIKSFYPEAEDGNILTERCMKQLLNEYGFDKEKTILGTSVCSDEIVRTATNFRDWLGIKNPFQLGGLGGFPFTGVTGFSAFASHIPDKGFAIIQYGPHIGFSKKDEIGLVTRPGQSLESTCCGALRALVNSFSGTKADGRDRELDYQQWKLEEELRSDSEIIKSHAEPLVAATNLMYNQINTRVKKLLQETSGNFENCTVALVGGIIINTDFELPDWFELREFSVHSF
ncbi:MAG: hypothetical protein WD604_11040 [Balneolaceae bacterium]